jgi:hypothetical protein
LVHAYGDVFIANSKEKLNTKVTRMAVSAAHKILQQTVFNDAVIAYAVKPVGRPILCEIVNYNNCSCIG